MEGPRPPHEYEYKKLVEFLDRSLRPGSQWSIENEYPTTLNLSNLNNMRVIFEEESVVSHAVLKPMIVKTPILLLKVGAIGSVVTDSEHRNKGFSKQIIDSCIQTAEAQGCDIAILWTNLYDFYRKFGFELAGSEISLVVHDEFSVPDEGLRIMESNKVSPDALLKLYNQHRVFSLRNTEDMKKFLNIPNSRVYTAWDTNNNLVAYAIEGKGADLTNYIHEWGGGVSKLTALFSHIRKKAGNPITVITPAHSQNLIRTMMDLGALKTDGYLGMIKILKPAQFCAKVKKAARALGMGELIFEKRGNEFFIGRAGQVFKTDSEADIVKLAFGPTLPSELYPFDTETKKILEQIFPLQMWMWGWDSI